MKIHINAATDIESIRKKISYVLHSYIEYDLWRQPEHDYYKQIRKQFTVNGRKYVVKNDVNERLHIINPEGKDLYGYRIPNYLDNNTTDNMALSILNDAYGDSLDISMRKSFLHYRADLQYGPVCNGNVYIGKYLDKMKGWTRDNSNGRYMIMTYTRWWSGHESNITWTDNRDEAIAKAEQFIEDGANSPSASSPTTFGTYDYSYYSNVIDSETGEEIYWDESTSMRI